MPGACSDSEYYPQYAQETAYPHGSGYLTPFRNDSLWSKQGRFGAEYCITKYIGHAPLSYGELYKLFIL